eukprot:TRINITY_DN111251_c0_g1_i1.p1 TRINITY_DN111251_c0_g1~~TRINITY_DN111251_c0_g1_i1.p1  ORF type:complete len:454 (+),score=93.33 TRINITY_DN111251_c0_g1_i1:133-1494(+)
MAERTPLLPGGGPGRSRTGVPPPPAAADTAWEPRAAPDPENPGQHKTCYYNTVTGESRWEKPAGQELGWRGRLRNMRKQAGESGHGIWGEAALAVAPWALFVLTSATWSFFWHGSSGILGVATVVLLLLLLVRMLISLGLGDVKVFGKPLGKPPALRHGPNAAAWAHPRLFAVCMLGVASGALVGYYNHQSGVRDYWAYYEHWQYTNVWPDEPAAAHRDASAIVFAEGARPDPSRSAMYTVGHHAYCAAPVRLAGQAGGSNVQYFAVGKDCCGRDPQVFSCGDAGSLAARAGLVVYDRTTFYDFLLARDYDFYQQASQIAIAKYGLAAAGTPIFLHWTTDIEWANSRIVWDAWIFLLKLDVLSLPLLILLELGVSRASAIARSGYGRVRKGNEATNRDSAAQAKKTAGPPPPSVVFTPSQQQQAMGGGGMPPMAPMVPPPGTRIPNPAMMRRP